MNHLTEQQIGNMVYLQDILNKGTNGSAWVFGKTNKGRNIDWDLCIMGETWEMIDSLNWKHWKDIDAPHDIENFKMEVIDIIHFMISKEIENEGGDVNKASSMIFREFESFSKVSDSLKGDIDSLLHISKQFFRNFDSEKRWWDLLKIAEIVGLTEKGIYELYVSKNILNKFRQDHGYLNGTYQKIWFIDGKEVEDNVVVTKILEENGIDDLDLIYEKLLEIYTEQIQNGLSK